ncbi:F5/8 type C domain-containing protein [Opitutaceae bacterium TAV1]|nr:F5/8 type C domain-containing protein [Opitutaceae bacterium TAV1]
MKFTCSYLASRASTTFTMLRLAGVAGAAFFLATASTAPAADLTQDATVRAAGTYTYYAGSPYTTTPFTTMFYPTFDRDNKLTGTAAPVSFATGYLTDGDQATAVRGWGGDSGGSPVTFDIVFDLGAVYTVSSVVVSAQDGGGARWDYTASQKVYTSLTAPVADAGLSLFGTADTDQSSVRDKSFTLNVTGAETQARYVIVRLTVGYQNAGSYGGYLKEVQINGGPAGAIPEASTSALIGGTAAALVALGVRRFRR